MKDNITRKEFVKKISVLGISFFATKTFLQSCKSSEKKVQDPCGDLSKLTKEEITERNQYQYVAKSPDPAELCDNCALWIEPETKDSICGTCDIMSGPINPKGYCNVWVSNE